jgi:hypothetical protein
MAHYQILFDHIATQIKTAWNATTIAPGRTAKPLPQLPRAVLSLESCSRELAGRSVEQTWTWQIGGQFPLPVVAGVDPQELMAIKAEALIQLLTPFSENHATVPPAPSPFAGIGYLPLVTEWTPMPLDDEDNAVAVMLSFQVRTTTWQ